MKSSALRRIFERQNRSGVVEAKLSTQANRETSHHNNTTPKGMLRSFPTQHKQSRNP